MIKQTFSIREEYFGDRYDEQYEPYIGEYTIKQLTFAESEEVNEHAIETKRNRRRKTTETKLKSKDYKREFLKACLVDAPFDIHDRVIEQIPSFIADFVYEKCDDFNSLFIDDKQGE